VNETLESLVFYGNRIDLNLKQFIAEPGLKSSFTRGNMDLAVKPTVTVIHPGNVIDIGFRRWGFHVPTTINAYIRMLRIRVQRKSSCGNCLLVFSASGTGFFQGRNYAHLSWRPFRLKANEPAFLSTCTI
jgi:hypothetical protein